MTAKVGNWIRMNESGAIGEVIEASANSWKIKYQTTQHPTSQAPRINHETTQWVALGTFKLIANPNVLEFVCFVHRDDIAGIPDMEFVVQWDGPRVPDLIITPEGVRLVAPAEYPGDRYLYRPATLVCDLRGAEKFGEPS